MLMKTCCDASDMAWQKRSCPTFAGHKHCNSISIFCFVFAVFFCFIIQEERDCSNRRHETDQNQVFWRAIFLCMCLAILMRATFLKLSWKNIVKQIKGGHLKLSSLVEMFINQPNLVLL